MIITALILVFIFIQLEISDNQMYYLVSKQGILWSSFPDTRKRGKLEQGLN